MNTIRPFHEMAKQQGTTLERALTNYVSMENKLRQDPIAGLDTIVYNLNLQAPDGTRLTFRDIAWHVLNQTPEQHQLLQAQNKADAQAQQIGQLHQTVSKLVNGIQQMQYQATFAQTRSALDRYADAHPRFDELGDLIEPRDQARFHAGSGLRQSGAAPPGNPRGSDPHPDGSDPYRDEAFLEPPQARPTARRAGTNQSAAARRSPAPSSARTARSDPTQTGYIPCLILRPMPPISRS